MQQYNLNKVIGVVELPDDAHNIVIGHTHGYSMRLVFCSKKYIPDNHRDVAIDLQFPCQFLSLSKDMTEEMAKMIIPNKPFESFSYGGAITEDLLYKDYEFDSWDLSSALKSLRSWERANGIEGNVVYLIKG